MGAEGVILLVRDVCCYLDGDLGQHELVCVAVLINIWLLKPMEHTLVTHVCLFKSLLNSDKFCQVFGTVSKATRCNNLEEFVAAKLAFENLLELQADKNIQERAEDDLRQLMVDLNP